jgi:hypothetical protein
VNVRVTRRGCEGPVHLEVQGLPGKVRHRLPPSPAIPANRDSVSLVLTAAADAAEGKSAIRIVATLGDQPDVRDGRDLWLTVYKSTPAAAARPAEPKKPRRPVKAVLIEKANLGEGFAKNTTLQAAIDFIDARHDLNILIEDRGGRNLGNLPVQLRLRPNTLTVREVLDRLAGQVNAACEVQADCVIIRPR